MTTDELLNVCRDLIAADTISEHGTDAAVRILKPLYHDAGLRVHVQEVRRPGSTASHQNLIGTFAGTDEGGLCLVTHLDTVDPGPLEMWTEADKRPFDLKRKDDLLYGLGSADTKLDAICKLIAARTFARKKLRRSLQLVGTFEEEIGCHGAKHFVRSGAFKSKFVSCSEPSELAIIRAHKGYGVIEVIAELKDLPLIDGALAEKLVEGKSAHSSTPHLGISAIEKALNQIGSAPVARFDAGTVPNKVPAQAKFLEVDSQATSGVRTERAARDIRPILKLAARIFEAWRDVALAQEPKSNTTFDPDVCVVNWGIAHIDDRRMQLVFDCRLLPGHVPDLLMENFEARANGLLRGSPHVGRFDLNVGVANPAMELKEPSELLEAARGSCRDLGLDDKPQAKPTNTEAGVFSSAGVEAIVFGPGRSTGNAHCANEHTRLSQLEKAIEFYRLLITRLCL